MKRAFFVLVFSTNLSGCFQSCAVGDPLALFSYCPREAYESLIHPKSMGEHWVKEGVSKEQLTSDWISCGGKPDLSDGVELTYGMTIEEYFRQYKQKVKLLNACMKSQNYKWIND